MESTALARLTVLVKEVAKTPELLFVATSAMADELDRLAINPKEAKRVRETSRAVGRMIGMEAESAWNKLSWREKFRNRKRKDAWQQEHTDALLEEGRRRVGEVLTGAR